MTEIVLGFEDNDGLMEALREIHGLQVDYTNEGLEAPSDSESLWIGAGVPFPEIKTVIVESLKRYEHIKYYKVSTDYYRAPKFIHNQIFVGGLTETSVNIGISPVEPATMLGKLETIDTADELFEFVRSHYPGEFKTWEIE